MRAVVFDFNGTLSDDEPVLARVYQELRPELTPEEYFTHLAGHTDEEILGPDPSLIARRVRRYNELVGGAHSVGPERPRQADHVGAGGLCGGDADVRVLEDQQLVRAHAEALGREQVGLGIGLAARDVVE